MSSNLFTSFLNQIQSSLTTLILQNSNTIKLFLAATILIAFHIYLGITLWYSFTKALALLILTLLFWSLIIYAKVLRIYLIPILLTKITLPAQHKFNQIWYKYRYLRCLSLLFINNVYFLVSWRPVVCGTILQFIFGLIILRWNAGTTAFQWISQQILAFLSYVNVGTSFVYGFLSSPSQELQSLGAVSTFAFGVIPSVIFFSSFISIIYYLGIMQIIITRIGWFMRLVMGTTAAETLNTAGNIFVGPPESAIIIKPFIPQLTESEIHAIMTAGYATISGSVFGAYVRFGICANHLLSAMFMSAPASLVTSKLMCPETEKSKTENIDNFDIDVGKEANILEAASNGASNAIFLVANILANLIIFLAFLAFANNVVSWLGEMVGVQCLSLERLLGYIFFPLAYVMGASNLENQNDKIQETLQVAELMGIKTFLNEFIAFQKLGELIKCNAISKRAQLIATYSLCGFSNISSIGMQIGGLGAICPEKRSTFARLAVRTLVAGSIACFMTACVAGILTTEVQGCGIPDLTVNCTILQSSTCS